MKRIDLIGALVFLSISMYSSGFQENVAIESIPLWVLGFAVNIHVLLPKRNRSEQISLSSPAYFTIGTLSSAILISTVIGSGPLTERLLGSQQHGDGLITYLAIILVFLGFIQVTTPDKSRIISWIIFTGSVQALVGLSQLLGSNVFNKIGYDGVTGTFSNTNTAGFFFAMLATILFSKSINFSVKSKGGLTHYSLTFVFTLAAIFTNTLQGPFLTIIGIACVVLIKIYAKLETKKSLSAKRTFKSLLLGILVLGVALIPPYFSKIETFKIRTYYWDSAWRMFTDNIFFGVGPGSFGSYVSKYRTEDYVRNLGSNIRVDDSHNISLHLLSTIGIVATLCVVISIGFILAKGLIRKKTDVEIIGVAMVLVFIFGSLISYFSSKIILLFVIFLASIIQPRILKQKNSITKYQSTILGSILLVVLGSSIQVINQTNIPETLSEGKAKALLGNSDLRCGDKVQLLSKAISSNVPLSELEIEKIYSSNLFCIEIGTAIARRDVLEKRPNADKSVIRVLNLDPYNPVLIGLLAVTTYNSGNKKEAVRLMKLSNSIEATSTLQDLELRQVFSEVLVN